MLCWFWRGRVDDPLHDPESVLGRLLETRYADRFEALNSVKAEIDFEAMGDIENERYTATVDNFESWKRERQVLLNGLTHSALARLT